LAAQALGAQHILGVLMPSPYSSDHSINDSIELAKNLKANYTTLPINDAFEVTKKTLAKEFENTHENVAEENIQSRLRGLLLMAMSNKFGHVLLNTSNKSEL